MKIVITGANGQLGLAFQREFTRRGLIFWAADHSACNITKGRDVNEMLDVQKPSALINCAAYNLVDQAEIDPTAAFAVNSDAVKILAQACRQRGIKFIHFSTDYVFDGKKNALYIEEDATKPLNVYGLSKLNGEAALSIVSDDYLIFRTSWVYGKGKQNFLYKISQWAQKAEEIKVSVDEISIPTYVDDIVEGTLRALEKGITGLYHLTSSGHASRYDWAVAYIKAAGLKTRVIPVPVSSFSLKAVRPLFSAMSNLKISKLINTQMPSWQEGIEKFVRS